MNDPQNLLYDQLHQVFEYAELLCRLKEAQKLLNTKGGYWGEKEVYDSIEVLKNQVHEKFEKHFSNSKLSEQALELLDQFKSIKAAERLGAKRKIREQIQGPFGVWQIVSILENRHPNSEDERIVYVALHSGHDGTQYQLMFEKDFDEIIKRMDEGN